MITFEEKETGKICMWQANTPWKLVETAQVQAYVITFFFCPRKIGVKSFQYMSWIDIMECPLPPPACLLFSLMGTLRFVILACQVHALPYCKVECSAGVLLFIRHLYMQWTTRQTLCGGDQSSRDGVGSSRDGNKRGNSIDSNPVHGLFETKYWE